MSLILCGFKKSGKSYFGKLLARFLNVPLIETDDLLEKRYFAMFGKRLPCSEIFRTLGNQSFRNLEKEVIENLQIGNNSIIATGGGCIRNSDNVLTLKKNGLLVYLKRDPKIVLERLLQPPLPAYINPANSLKEVQKMIEELSPLYEAACDVHLSLEGATDEEILLKLVNCYQQQDPHGKQ